MENKEISLERLSELNSDINNKRKFGVDFTEEEQEADKIEKHFIDSNAKRLNDEFIVSHNWQGKHIIEARKWDLIIYRDIVCRVSEINRKSFNEGMDTYNYEAKAKGIFIDYEFNFEFGYNETIKMLEL